MTDGIDPSMVWGPVLVILFFVGFIKYLLWVGKDCVDGMEWDGEYDKWFQCRHCCGEGCERLARRRKEDKDA